MGGLGRATRRPSDRCNRSRNHDGQFVGDCTLLGNRQCHRLSNSNRDPERIGDPNRSSIECGLWWLHGNR